MLYRLSIKYWTNHKRKMNTLAAVILIGAAALCIVLLFVRSNKQNILNKELDLLGNYDAVFYEVDHNDVRLISNNKNVIETGYYSELGYASVMYGSDYKVVSFPDEQSISMYNETCIKGRYPEDSNEIAVDISAMKEMGLPPVIGENIELTLYDIDKKEITCKTLTVTGIFEAGSSEAYRGFYRYPISIDSYNVPQIIVHKSIEGEFECSTVTVFVQIDEDITDTVRDILSNEFSHIMGYEIPLGRTYAYSYVLGISDHINAEYGEVTIDKLIQAMHEGNVWRDFYSSVAVPFFSCLVFLIVFMSVFGIINNVLEDRSYFLGVLLSLGMTKRTLSVFVVVEQICICVCLALVGVCFGIFFHNGMISIINSLYDNSLPSGVYVSEYVKSVTFSPFSNTVLIIVASSLLAISISVIIFFRRSPIQMLNSKGGKIHIRKGKIICVKHKGTLSLKEMLDERISLTNITVIVTTSIIMSVSFLSYNYFKALSDLNNTELEYMLRENELDKWDYVISKTDDFGIAEFAVENHHNSGIARDSFVAFADNNYVLSSYARIVNRSTRVSYYSDSGILLPDYLNLKKFKPSNNEYDNSLYEAEEAMIVNVGYISDESIYSLPTIGVMESEFTELKKYVVEGDIHFDRIANGEEIVLCRYLILC